LCIRDTDRAQPIGTLALGAGAVFLAGGGARKARVARVAVGSGDVVVMSGPTRMAYHGIDRLLPTLAPLTADGSRLMAGGATWDRGAVRPGRTTRASGSKSSTTDRRPR